MAGSDTVKGRKVGGRILRFYQGAVLGLILLNIFISGFGSESVVNEIAFCY